MPQGCMHDHPRALRAGHVRDPGAQKEAHTTVPWATVQQAVAVLVGVGRLGSRFRCDFRRVLLTWFT